MNKNSRFKKFLSMLMVLTLLMQYSVTVSVFAEDGAGDTEAAVAAQEAKAAAEKEAAEKAAAEKAAAEKAAAEKAAAEKAAAEKAAAEKAAAEKAAAEKAAAEKAAAEKAAAEQAAAEKASAPDDTPAPQEPAAPEQKQEESQDLTESDQTTDADTDDNDPEMTRGPDAEEGEAVAEPEAAPEEEALEEEEEEEEEELKYPAKTFKGSANGVNVVINAPEGALPEGTEMTVSGVAASRVADAVDSVVSGEVTKIKAVDITFRDKDGKEIEPKKNVSVHMSTSAMPNEGDQNIVHIENNGSASVVTGNVNNGAASFKTDSFSIYVVVETGEDARLTVNFVVKGSTKSMQINQRQADTHMEEYIYDPGVGNLGDNEMFKGWTTDENYTSSTSGMTIADVRNEVKTKLDAGDVQDGDSVTYYAMIFKAYNITYRDEKGVAIKTDQVVYRYDDTATSHSYTVNLSYTPYAQSAEEQEEDGIAEFMGWDDADGNLYEVGDTIENITSDVTLRADVKNGHWLTFDENISGATYTQPQFVVNGGKATEPADPTRAGYTFGGWYTSDASSARDGQVSGSEFDFNAAVNANTTVYGKWTRNNRAQYTVIIWKQKVDGSGYDFAESINLNGNVGSTIDTVVQNGSNVNTGTTPAQTRNVTVNGTQKAYTGFHCDHFDSNVTINAEGTSVLNVYYNRNTITITFNAGNNYYIYDANTGGYAHTVTYSGLYEAPLTFDWPTTKYTGSTGTGASATLWQYTSGGRNTILSLIGSFKLPTNTDVSISFTRSDAGNNEVRFYQMDGNGNYSNTPKDTVGMDGVSGFTFTEKYTGFELDTYRSYGWNGWSSWNAARVNGNAPNNISQLEIRYKRVQKSITYLDGVYVDHTGAVTDQTSRGQLNKTDPMYYGADVTSYGEGGSNYYAPTYPGYVFDGWYADDKCSSKYDFTTMPPDGITVYAKWVAREYAVQLHVNDSEDDPASFIPASQAPFFHADFGDKVGTIVAERKGYDLIGWFTDEACTHAYSFSAYTLNDDVISQFGDATFREEGRPSVVGKLNLYAKWRSKLDGALGINVVYDAGDGTGAPPDNNNYTDLAEAVAGNASTPNDDTKVFSHWVLQTWDESGYKDTAIKVFPGDTFIVKKSDAKEEAVTDSTDPSITKKFTVQLRAEYIEKDEEIKTHIYWFDNYTGGKVAENNNLKINEAVDVPAAPTRSGYEFKGWVRDAEHESGKTDSTTLFITYTDGAYNHTQVAADENWADDGNQYHALYALWEAKDVNYTVEFYYQNDNGEGYNKDESLTATRPAKTDSTVNATDADKAQTKNNKYKLHEGDPNVLSATVAGDGSTVLKVYFDLNQVDVTVEHYLLGQTAAFKTDTIAKQTVGSTYTATPETTYQEKNLTVNSYDPTQAITVKTSGNIIKIYYTLPLTITAKTDSKTYDGTPLNGEYTVDGALAADETAINTALGTAPSITNVSESPKAYLTKEDQAKITGIPGYYVVTYTPGTLTINPRAVTLTSATDSKVYDGTALTNDTVTVGGDGFVAGEGATYDVTGTQTVVGSSANAFTYTLNEGTVETNYNITKTEGTLTVTELTDKVTVTITENSGSEKYDGSEKTVTGYTVSINNPLYKEADFTFSGNATVKGTDAGSYPMELKPEDFTNNNANFANVEFVILDGTLEIAKRSVTLTSADGEKVYDGTALVKNAQTDVTVGGDRFAEGEGAVYNITGTQTEVGSSANAFTYTLNDGTKAANYDITKTEGTLTVTELTDKVTVTITENSGSEKYDGAEKTVTGYTVSIDNPLYTEEDFSFTGDATVKGTDAGSYPMELKPADFTNISKNFKNVEFIIVDGTLEIAKRTVTLTSADDRKVYDGTALTNDTVTVGGDGFAEGEGAAYNVTGTQTEVGSSANAFTYTLNDGTKAANYTITKTEGTLTVTELTDKVTVTITENSGSEKYDGTEKTVTGYKVSIDNPLYKETDFTFSGNATVKGTDAGSYPMELKPADFTNISKNFKEVEFVIVDGTLEVAKRTVTLTSADGEKVYDGTALVKNAQTDVTVGGDGFAEGEGATYDITGTRTNVGSTPNTFTYALNDGTKAANYDITKTEGTLTVTELTDKVTVTITENSGSEKYDGSEKTVTGYTVAINNSLYTVADFTFSGDATVKGTDAGSYPMELKSEDFTNNNANFANVEFVIEDGTLEIAKRTVTLTSADGKKVYDGEALVKNEQTDVTVSGDGFVTGEGATYAIIGTQTLVGSSDNTFTYTLNEGTKADNYTIKTVFGTLTVTDGTDPDEPDVPSDKVVTKTDGKDVKYHVGDTVEWTVWVKNIYDETKTLTVTEAPGMTIVGTVPETLSAGQEIEIKVQHVVTAADVTAGSITNNVTVKLGDLEKPGTDTVETEAIEIEITAASDSKVYDGEALTNSEYEQTAGTLAEGDAIDSVTVTGSQTLVGESANVASEAVIKHGDEDVTAGYKITYVDGTLTVTDGTKPDDPKPVDDDKVVTKNDANEDKDAKYHVGDTVTWKIWVKNIYDEEKSLTVTEQEGVTLSSYPATLKAGEEVTITATHVITAEDVTAGTYKNTVKAQLGDLEKQGDDTVDTEPIKITITADSATKVYDGSALTKDSYKLTSGELAEGNKIASVKVTGSQTLVGSSANVASDAKIVDAAGKDVTAGYTITYADGTLTVTDGSKPDEPDVPDDKVVKKTSEGQSFHIGDTVTWKVWVKNIYDEEKKLTVTEAAGMTIVDPDPIPASMPAGAELTITVQHVVTAADVRAGSIKNDVTVKLDDYEKHGEDTVDTLPIAITITANSGSKVYDGTALRVPTYRLTAGKLATGDKISSVVVTGSRTSVGTSANVPSNAKIVNAAGEDVTAGYKITYVNGTLRVRPVPGGGDDDTPTPGGGGGPGVTPPAPAPVPAAIDDEPVPAAEPEAEPEPIEIDDEDTPLAQGAWALVNLICAALATVGAAVALFRKKEDEEDEEDEEAAAKKAAAKAADGEEEEEQDNRARNMTIAKVLGAVTAIASIVAFILTEDMSLPMIMTDKWTLLMVVLFAGQIATAVANKKASESDDEKEEEEGAQA